MKTFEIYEEARPGLTLVRDDEPVPEVVLLNGGPATRIGWPYIEVPKGCRPMLLQKNLAECTCEVAGEPGSLFYGVGREMTRGGERFFARNMDVQLGDRHVILGWPSSRPDRRALVRICTAAGEGGKVRMTSDGHYPVLERNNTVRREYRGFPDAGVTALVDDVDVLKEINEGVEFLDLFILMYPQSCFRIVRTGKLDGDPDQFRVYWTGNHLDMKAQGVKRQERAADAFGAATAAA